MKCKKCDQEVVLPFSCTYCGEAFCDEHRLPESHECRMLPKDSKFWYRKKRLVNVNEKYGICPNCGSQSSQMTNYDARTMTYQCKECGQKFTQLKSFPNSYVEPRNDTESHGKPIKRRHFPVRKVIGIMLAIMIIGALLWYAPTIISFVRNFSSQSSYTKLKLMNSNSSTKVQFGDIDYNLTYTSSSQNNNYYLFVENSLVETKLYLNPTNGSDYKDIGIEMKVSEVHSDYIVLLVKSTVENYLAQSGYVKLIIANGQYQTINFSGNEYIFSYAYTFMNSNNQGMVGAPVLTIGTPLLQTEQRYLSTPTDQFTSKFGLNITAWAVPEYVTVFVKPSY